jgi:hypothetical protein
VAEGAITLGDFAAKTPTLNIACTRCERGGRVRLGPLIALHGSRCGIPTLLRLLSEDCEKRQLVSAYDLCGVHCPDLPGLFLNVRD